MDELNPEGDYVVINYRRLLKQGYRWTRYSVNGKKLSGPQESYLNYNWACYMARRCNVGCEIRNREGDRVDV